jgi:hypothetical protein
MLVAWSLTSSQLSWPGLEVSPDERRGKDNEHRDYGDRD